MSKNEYLSEVYRNNIFFNNIHLYALRDTFNKLHSMIALIFHILIFLNEKM